MNFIKFSAETSNLFPAANLTSGGQLVTEWNLRSREMVLTDPAVTYEIGPSYVHGEKDFEVELQKDGGGSINSSYILSVAEGRAVINGHYFESLVPVEIDLAAANNKLASESRPILKGKLAIGIRAYYATEETIAGSILTEDEDDMLLGIQLVILPKDEMITPSDSPLDLSKVTAHLVLAEFQFTNNVVTNIKNLASKMQYITSERVKDIDTIISNKYITKTGLNSKKLYAFAGKGADPSIGRDTWEDVTDSLMVWDAQPQRTTDSTANAIKQAAFIVSTNNTSYSSDTTSDATEDGVNKSVYLVVPHKQVYGMQTDDGKDEYYAPRIMKIPEANYSTSEPGIVTSEYNHRILQLAEKVRDLRNTLSGKQVMFMDTRTVTTALPSINPDWNIGDYVLVKNDDYMVGGADTTESSPATMYVILPGEVITVQFITKVHGNASVEPKLPENIKGAEIGLQDWYESTGQTAPDTEHPEYYPKFFDSSYPPRGVPYNSETEEWNDYFRIRYYLNNRDGQYPDESYPFDDYYYGVYTTGPRAWSDAVMVTGSVALATETTIGGFYNASEQSTDSGYVRVDDSGHLKLIDYELLRSGTLAYQLGEDIVLPTNIGLTEIQTYLTEYVNNRVAFPPGLNYTATPSVIHVYITILASETGGTLEIGGIDSRFNTAVWFHILGEAGSNVTINIRDCEKIVIDPTIQGTPVINVIRSCIRYDAQVFNYIRTCERDYETYGSFKGMRDISLWYEQIEETDPILTINDMTVCELDSHLLVADINYWKELDNPIINDNDYLVALKSITFSGDGDIIGCEILVSDNSTDNIVIGEKMVVGETVLPQGSSLTYPISCLTKMLKIDGTFTSAYYAQEQWYVTDTSFTMLSGTFNEADPSTTISGQVAFHSKTSILPQTLSQKSIAAWEPDTYHVFRGGSIN